MPTRAPTAPPSTKVLSRCLFSTFVSFWASRVILTAFCAGDGDPLPGRTPVEEHRRGMPARPFGYPRDPVGHDLDGRVRGVLYGEVLHGLHTGPGGTLDDVVVDLAYLLEVGDVLLCRTTHRRAKSPDVETRAVNVLVPTPVAPPIKTTIGSVDSRNRRHLSSLPTTKASFLTSLFLTRARTSSSSTV